MISNKPLSRLIYAVLFFCVSFLAFHLFKDVSRQIPPPSIDANLHVQQATSVPGVFEVAYLHSMMLHHDQAITLAMIAEDGGFLPEVKRVARAIVFNQLHEIGQMRGWLSAWGYLQAGKGLSMDWINLVEPRNYVDELYVARCASNQNRMPGYFLPREIDELRQAKGIEKDRLFLEMMLLHHDEAVQMSGFVNNYAKTGLIKGLTRSIVVEQALEMAHFKKILESMGS